MKRCFKCDTAMEKLSHGKYTCPKCMNRCAICGEPKEKDMFSAVTGEPVCSICKIKFIGGLPTTQSRINFAREALGLRDGEYLKQDNPKEAARILGRS